MTAAIDTNGYRRLRLSQRGVGTLHLVHHLVAEAFHGPRPDGMVVRRRDGDALNNCADNLWWGPRPEAEKTTCPAGHPYTPENTSYLRQRGGGQVRRCRRCRHDQSAEGSAAQQRLSETSSSRRGYRWTGAEMEILARTDLTAHEKAELLNRTFYAVVTALTRLRAGDHRLPRP